MFATPLLLLAQLSLAPNRSPFLAIEWLEPLTDLVSRESEWYRLHIAWISVVVSSVAYGVARYGIVRLLTLVIRRSRVKWDDVFLSKRVLHRLALIAPAVLLHPLARLVFAEGEPGFAVTNRIATIVLTLVVLSVIDALLNGVVEIYRSRRVSRAPIRGFVQFAKLILWLVAGIYIVSLVVDKDPSKLLAGLGALTAVFLLIFKDTILGFVAGIQILTNDLVRPGDWVEMSQYGADGNVLDIALTTVKIQNWDMTISTVPSYAFTSESFRNWRGMTESSGRRIKRSISISIPSIRFCDEEMLERFRQIQHIEAYIEAKKSEVAEYNAEHHVDDRSLVNGRRLTNIGTFRAYIDAYLRHHPWINKGMTFLVRQLAPTEKGVPIEIYVFSSDKNWVRYEGIQSDIFDHLLAVAPEFDLEIFQSPTGDLARLGS